MQIQRITWQSCHRAWSEFGPAWTWLGCHPPYVVDCAEKDFQRNIELVSINFNIMVKITREARTPTWRTRWTGLHTRSRRPACPPASQDGSFTELWQCSSFRQLAEDWLETAGPGFGSWSSSPVLWRILVLRLRLTLRATFVQKSQVVQKEQ